MLSGRKYMTKPATRLVERGLSSLEVTLILPLFVLLLYGAMGMGEIMIVRLHSVMAARYAANYHSLNSAVPKDSLVSNAVSAGTEKWKVTARIGNSAGSMLSRIGKVPSIISGAISRMASGGGSMGVINYEARSIPTRGFLAETGKFGPAVGGYQTLNGTWTCRTGGGVMSIIRIPGLKLPSSLTPCKSYNPPTR
jgi:hypothetical protein